MSAPMCVDSGKCGLEQSRHNPEYGVSAEAPRPNNEITTPEQANRQLETLKTTFFNLVAVRDIEKALETATAFIEAAETRVNALERRANDASHNDKNSNEDIAKIIRTEVKTAVQTALRETGSTPAPSTTPKTWANVASSRPWGAGALAGQEPHIVVPARREREVVVRKGDGDASQRTPVEVVRAVNSALGSSEAVAARRLQSGDTLITFSEGVKFYKTDDI